MTPTRTDQALQRIDRALQRIATATARADALLADQARRNDRLRQAIGETLRDLDQLISEQEPE